MFSILSNTLFRVIMALVLAITITIAPGMGGNAAEKTPVDIKPVPAAEASSVIKNASGKEAHTIVFVFASWCPHCRRNFPFLVNLAQKYQKKDLNVVAISVDKDKAALTRFLAGYDSIPFTPYFAMQRFSGDLAASLADSGIRYNGSVPFLALLDKQGRIMGQGNYSIASVEKVLHTLLPN